MIALLLGAIPTPVLAQAVLLDNTSRSLKGIPVPVTPGLLDGDQPIVVDKTATLQLGKALFWDMNVGSDGVACATCHFHAGADRRVRNQLDTGVRHEKAPTGTTFEKTASGATGGPNYTLKSKDFPLHQLEKPDDKKSRVLYNTDDVVSSSWAFFGELQTVKTEGDGNAVCKSLPDPIFHAGGANTRRVATRNAPTVINAVFSYRGFWDGRANNLFNGETAFGPRDKEAGVWEVVDGKPIKTHPLLKNSSLASQAVAPPLDMKEMSCTLRTFPLLGRKLLKRRPLEFQDIHPEDSVLGAVRDASGKGLAATYGDLIRKSFARRYWSGSGDFGRPVGNGEPWTQAEANFAFFFGLAIQLYEATLISDDSPFDSPRDAQGYPTAFNEQQRRGHDLFQTEVCQICHTGPNLSLASQPELMDPNSPRPPRLVDRRVLNGDFDGYGVVQALVDVGFANTSVVPTANDIGVGGKDPFGNPLSFTEQYVNSLLDPKQTMVDPIRVLPCWFTFPFVNDYKPKELQKTTEAPECGNRASNNPAPTPATVKAKFKKHEQGRMLAAIKGAFKIPSLRNVELTGPYMHNGGMKSLDEVIDFYDRGGNAFNTHHFATGVFTHGLTAEQKADIVAFLKGLTDERVRWERAPFDHPSLSVPHGHGDGASARGPQYAADDFIQVPAVGKAGRAADWGPLQEFQSFLPD
ncbi:MAG: cytochrome-c peroxidase [Methylococcus sp.]